MLALSKWIEPEREPGREPMNHPVAKEKAPIGLWLLGGLTGLVWLACVYALFNPGIGHLLFLSQN